MKNKKQLNDMLTTMFQICSSAFHGKVDRGGNAYIMHCIRVMMQVGSDIELQCIALGHDLIEDTYVTEKILKESGISQRIIDGIVCLTKQKNQTYEEYIDQIFTNLDARLVKIKDIEDNLNLLRLDYTKKLTQKDIDRIEKYRKTHSELVNNLSY